MAEFAAPEVIIPNLHARYSGVTAANRLMGPRMARLRATAWLGSHRPQGVPQLDWGDLLALRFTPGRRVWHARRNDEMIVGLVLKTLGWRLKLVFTSAAQRSHKPLTRWLISRMDAVIATSALSAAYLERRPTIIHHGVDTELFHPADDRAAAWSETGLPGRQAIGCFGRVRRQKGTDLFVAAMIRALPRHPDWAAVIMGQITPEEQGFADGLRRQVAEAGLAERIVFLGERPIEEVPYWHRRIAVFAFTSRNEGFGLTLLEAMASGAAVVAARAGAAEIVVSEPETGLLVPTDDAEALHAACDGLMANPGLAEAMGNEGRSRVLAHHSVDAEAAAISRVYDDVLGR